MEDGDRVVTLEPYGFRPGDHTRHRQLTKSAGPGGWWGWIQENDDPDATPGGREHARLAALSLTCPEVGATDGGSAAADSNLVGTHSVVQLPGGAKINEYGFVNRC